jgi:hypothetical protein
MDATAAFGARALTFNPAALRVLLLVLPTNDAPFLEVGAAGVLAPDATRRSADGLTARRGAWAADAPALAVLENARAASIGESLALSVRDVDGDELEGGAAAARAAGLYPPLVAAVDACRLVALERRAAGGVDDAASASAAGSACALLRRAAEAVASAPAEGGEGRAPAPPRAPTLEIAPAHGTVSLGAGFASHLFAPGLALR